MENVGELVRRGLREVLGSLAEIGYNAEWQDIRASDMGAPHRRERIWIVAYAEQQTESPEINGRTIDRCKRQEMGIKHRAGGQDVADTRCKSERREEEFKPAYDQFNRCCPMQHGKENKRITPKNVPDNYGERCKEQYNGITEGARDFDGRDDRRKAEHSGWSTEPDVGMLVNGISVKLVGGLNYAGMESQKSGTESAPENGEMRVVRSNGEITETPSGHKKGNRNNNTVPDMSCKSGQIARDEKIKTDAEMCGVRKDIQSSRQPHSQNLQLRLSENPRERKRIEAVAWECEPAEIGRLATGVKNRVDRLKGLGNAIVPQIAELLFNQIKVMVTNEPRKAS